MPKVLFYFDFGSPNAYLSHRVIPDIEARTGVKFDYVPVLLGGLFKLTGNQSPMAAFGGIRNKLAYENLETERFIRRHGLTAYQFNPNFPINTLKLMRGAVAARAEGVFEPYVEAMFHHMWEAPKKLDDPAVFHAALLESGLDADRLIARTDDPQIKQTLMANTDAACERGAFGIPSFLVGAEIFFGKDRLRDVEEMIVQGA